MKRFLLFFIILALGIYLRFDRLTIIPPSLSHDETAIAYNAYSILKTGKDEYGKPFPLLFRSFDDYKLPGMVYATAPMVAMFGLTELAARLPSAIFGILSIIVMYGLAIELLGTKRRLTIGKRTYDAALLPTLMFAISPWHINFSRQLFESNGSVFWFMLGTYFLLRSRKNYNELLWAGLAYVMALYFYYSVRLVIPFVGLLYLISYWKTMKKEMKTTIVIFAVCAAAFLPIANEMLSPGGRERISIVSVANDPTYIKRRDAYVQKMGTNPSTLSKIIYNRRIALIQTVIENYGKNLSPRNLFVTGTGTYGTLYPFEIILIPLGIIAVFSLSRFSTLVTLVWLFTAFLPGAFSVNQPNTLRTLIAAPVFSLISGLGIYYALSKVKTYRTKWHLPLTIVIFLLMILQAFPKFHNAYFVDNPRNNALSFGDGYKQMIEYVKAHESEYDRIYVSGYYWRPYIFLLYWGTVNPTTYQQSGSREKFGKYVFSSASWDTSGMKFMDPEFNFADLPHDGKTLFILSKPEYELHQKQFRLIETISGRLTPTVFVAAMSK